MSKGLAKALAMASAFSAMSYPLSGNLGYNPNGKDVNGDFTPNLKPNRKRTKPATFKKGKRTKNKLLYSKKS